MDWQRPSMLLGLALLMYADDIVMLARMAEELMAMNKIATDFAHKHRFQFNGKKSGRLLETLTGSSEGRRWMWSMSTPTSVPLQARMLLTGRATSRRRSKRRRTDRTTSSGSAARDSPPRSWHATAHRPIIEYASKIWCGQIPAYLVDEAEAMQLKF
jgi:hypothetical protein